MRTTTRRLAAVMSAVALALGVLALPAAPAVAAANDWTCDFIYYFEPPNSYSVATGQGNCTGGDPQNLYAVTITARSPGSGALRGAICGRNSPSSAPARVVGYYCSRKF